MIMKYLEHSRKSSIIKVRCDIPKSDIVG